MPTLIREIAANLLLPPENVIDIHEHLGGAELRDSISFCDEQSCDPVHPNDHGYNKIAEKVYETIFSK